MFDSANNSVRCSTGKRKKITGYYRDNDGGAYFDGGLSNEAICRRVAEIEGKGVCDRPKHYDNT